jgi:hypothetical protein
MRLLPARRYHDQSCELTNLRVCEINCAQFCDHSVARTLARRRLCNQSVLADGIDSRNGEPCVPGSAYIECVSSWGERKVVHAVPGING